MYTHGAACHFRTPVVTRRVLADAGRVRLLHTLTLS
jgi:hypothetical protein